MGAEVFPHPLEKGPIFTKKRQFGRYQLLYRFASGGMAELYLGRLSGADGFEKLVAVKVIHKHLTEYPDFVHMFIDEARLASRIAHPNVVQIIELGKVDQTHFIAMEYVEGESVVAILRKVRPPTRVAARVVADAAAGLHAAHELRDEEGELLHVVHRDVSPHNILVSYKGATKVVDFGVARARGSLHTTKGELKGKIAYMAPEQLKESEKVDRRTDIFALGVVLYEMTTRRRLFGGDTEGTQISRVLQAEILPPSSFIKDYPADLEQIVLRALKRDQTRRFQTAQELQLALEKYIAGSGEPVLQSQVGEFMSELFGERIADKKQALHKASSMEVSDVLDAEMVSGLSLPMGSAGSLLQSRRRRVLALVIGAALVAAVAAVITVLVVSKPEPVVAAGASATDGGYGAVMADSSATISTRADSASRTITISVRASPEDAKILLDGREVANPLKLEQPAREGHGELQVQAPGYKTQRFEVSLGRGGTWVIALQQDRSKRPHRSRAGHRRGKKPKKGKLGDDDVLDSPYE